MDVAEMIESIIDREGGDKFTDIPGDKGGPTRFGVTLPAMTDWLGRPATVADLKAMTRKDAHELYHELYLRRPGFGVIGSQSLLSLLVDTAVNHGVRGATMLLQRAVGVKDDGVFGPVTRQAVLSADFNGLYRNLIAERVRHRGAVVTTDYKKLLADFPGLTLTQLADRVRRLQAKFAHGWANRDADFIERV